MNINDYKDLRNQADKILAYLKRYTFSFYFTINNRSVDNASLRYKLNFEDGNFDVFVTGNDNGVVNEYHVLIITPKLRPRKFQLDFKYAQVSSHIMLDTELKETSIYLRDARLTNLLKKI